MATLSPCPGEPCPGLGAGGEGWRWAPAPMSLRQSAGRQPAVPAPPGSAAERLCPLCSYVGSSFFFPPLSSAIFPLQSIAGNRMWVTQQHCFKLRKLPLLLPKGSGGTRGCRGGCRSPAGTNSAQGWGYRCSPSHVLQDRGSCLGPLGLNQPLEGSVLRGDTRNKEGSANFTPESRQLQRRKVRQLATLVGRGGDTGMRSAQARLGGDRGGGTPVSMGGSLAGAWAHLSSPLPPGTTFRLGDACGALAGSPLLVPMGRRGDKGAFIHPGCSCSTRVPPTSNSPLGPPWLETCLNHQQHPHSAPGRGRLRFPAHVCVISRLYIYIFICIYMYLYIFICEPPAPDLSFQRVLMGKAGGRQKVCRQQGSGGGGCSSFLPPAATRGGGGEHRKARLEQGAWIPPTPPTHPEPDTPRGAPAGAMPGSGKQHPGMQAGGSCQRSHGNAK